MAAQMSFSEFEKSLTSDSNLLAGLSVPLQAMWLDARGDWSGAHALAQRVDGAPEGAWVHAYLHRKEGDDRNAAYWYAKAGKPVAKGAFETEWRRIVDEVLKVAAKG